MSGAVRIIKTIRKKWNASTTGELALLSAAREIIATMAPGLVLRYDVDESSNPVLIRAIQIPRPAATAVQWSVSVSAARSYETA